ncbi:MAG: hypothetical protein JW874_01505 [Spirochaetales bacterium]|nr:hypothetical protein [Spirochaetales bacterium]
MEEIYNMLVKYSLRMKKHILDFVQFSHFVLRSLPEQGNANDPNMFSPLMVASELEALAESMKCELAYEAGKINTIIFPAYFTFAVKFRYKEMDKNYELPFPSDSEFGGNLPADIVRSVNIKEEFLKADKNQLDPQQLTRIHFPEGVNSILVPNSLLGNKLMELAVQKIKMYLNDKRNGDYMQSKMRVVFRQRERAVKDMFTSVLSQTRNAISSLASPTDFSFQFWNHLSSSIIQEFREKSNKMEKEHSFCQAAYLISHFNLHYKSRIQKKKEQELALKAVKTRLRKSPYFFTLSDIYAFKDDKGIKLSRKYDVNALHKYLEEKIKPLDDKSLPEILRIKAENKKEYFICTDTFIPLCLKKTGDARKSFREFYLNDWIRKLNAYRTTKTMHNEDSFEEDVKRLVKSEDPLMDAMLRYDLLFLTLAETKPRLELATEIERYLDRSHKSLQPYADIFNLDRHEILKQARSRVPVWKTNPVLRFLVKLFLGVGKGVKEEKSRSGRTRHKSTKKDSDIASVTKSLDYASSAGQASGVSAPIRYANAIRALKTQFIGEDGDLNLSLKELEAKWNPLFDEQMKKNLVEDVNSMIRDYLRKLKRGFMIKPPDRERIENISDQLAMNAAFHKIKRKDYFKRYIALYMLQILGQVK